MNQRNQFILGFSDSVHDRSVCIFDGARPLVAIEEERLSRVKHGLNLYRESRTNPALFASMNLENSGADANQERLMPAVRYCLDALGLQMADLSLIIGNSLHIAFPFREQAVYLNHHLAHAASAFFGSGFSEAAILVADGYGDLTSSQTYETVLLADGHDSAIDVLRRVTGRVSTYYDMENSLGVFYRIGTLLSGFGVFDEGKAMGLSAYGKPRHVELIRAHIAFEEGRVLIDNKAIWDACSAKLGGQSEFQPRADIAASFQALLEEVVMHYAQHLRATTGRKRLCIAGGVGLNCVSNAKLQKHSGFEEVFVFPAAGDNGIAFGAAYFAAHSILGLPRTAALHHAYFGRTYTASEVKEALSDKSSALNAEELPEGELTARAAAALHQGHVIMWFQGGSEIGPRALGHRSILASPVKASTRDHINALVKYREAFRPLAPMVLEECVAEYFEFDSSSPFMLFSPTTTKSTRQCAPAIVHHDGTARLQTISRAANSLIHQLITAFRALSGVPIVLNTSLNGKDEPIVETPTQALDAFLNSPVQHLFIEGHLVVKKG